MGVTTVQEVLALSLDITAVVLVGRAPSTSVASFEVLPERYFRFVLLAFYLFDIISSLHLTCH